MGIKVLATNKKAFHEYQILDRFEAGISLLGTEVKSIRNGKVSLGEGWVNIDDDGVQLIGVHVSHYSHGNINNHEEKRQRRLLLHKKEIIKLSRGTAEKGLSIVPIKIYAKGQLIKVEIALAKGKKLHDKRQASKEKDANRDIARALQRR